jgi:hypothetical protein
VVLKMGLALCGAENGTGFVCWLNWEGGCEWLKVGLAVWGA